MHDEAITPSELSLRDYLDILRRRSFIILVTFLVVFIAGAFVVRFVQKPVYRAEGKLLINPQNIKMVSSKSEDPSDILSGNTSSRVISTQIQVLLTDKLLEEAITRVNKAHNAPQEKQFKFPDPRIRVVPPNDDGKVDIIPVAVEAHTPEAAKEIAQSLMEVFMADNLQRLKDQYKVPVESARQEVQKTKNEWQEAVQALLSYNREMKNQVGLNYQDELDSRKKFLAFVKDTEQQLEVDIAGVQADINKRRETLASLPQTIRTVQRITNPDIAVIQKQMGLVEVDIQAKQTTFKPEHPIMKSLFAQQRELERMLREAPATVPIEKTEPNPEVDETAKAVRFLEAQANLKLAAMARVQAQKAVALKGLENQGKQVIDQTNLMLDRDQKRGKYEFLQQKLSDLELQQATQISPLSILSDASKSNVPVGPSKWVRLLLFAIMGLFLGVCFALLQEFLDDRVRTPEEARRLIGGVPTLSVVPRIKAESRLLIEPNVSYGVLESYRALRNNVRFAAVGEPVQSIMVTSTKPGEGKSTTAVNLAVAMAMDGKRVILVDGDLRRPTVHDKFNVLNITGLTDVLVGKTTLEKALQEISLPLSDLPEPIRLQILTAGPEPPNPTELLSSRRMLEVLDELRQRADYIIFDSPPTGRAPDAQVLSATVDGVIYVVQLGAEQHGLADTLKKWSQSFRHRKSSEELVGRNELKRCHEVLRQAQARILGIVFNKYVQEGRNDYYGYYGYNSYYGNYYGYGRHKRELSAEEERASGGAGPKELPGQQKDNATTAMVVADPPVKRPPSASNGHGSHLDSPNDTKE